MRKGYLQRNEGFAIVGGQVLTKNGFEKTDLLVEGRSIKDLGRYKNVRNGIDATSCLIVPGFINSHAHLGETIFKDAIKFSNLNEYIEKTEQVNLLLSEKSGTMREASSSKTIIEFIRSGITTVCAGRCEQECETAGLSSFSGYMLMKSKKLEKYFTSFDSEFGAFSQKIKGTGLSKPFLFLHSLEHTTDEMIQVARRTMTEKRIPLLIHVAETKEEELEIIEKTGLSSVAILDKNSLITNSTLLVHCCNISDKDIEVIKRRDATVVLCPSSNVRLNNQVPSFDKMLKMGVNLCVATDGLATTLTKNILSECLFLRGEFKKIKGFEWLGLITSNPAKALGIRAGSIDKGQNADIAIFGPDKRLKSQMIKKPEIADALSELEVRDVICAGKIVMQNGKILTIDEQKASDSFTEFNRQVKELNI